MYTAIEIGVLLSLCVIFHTVVTRIIPVTAAELELLVVVSPSVDVSIVNIPHRHQKTALLATYVSQTQSSQPDNCTVGDVGIGFGNHEILPY